MLPRKQVGRQSVPPAPRSGRFLLPGSQGKVGRSCGHLGPGRAGGWTTGQALREHLGTQPEVRLLSGVSVTQPRPSCPVLLGPRLRAHLPGPSSEPRQATREGRKDGSPWTCCLRRQREPALGALPPEPEASQAAGLGSWLDATEGRRWAPLTPSALTGAPAEPSPWGSSQRAADASGGHSLPR